LGKSRIIGSRTYAALGVCVRITHGWRPTNRIAVWVLTDTHSTGAVWLLIHIERNSPMSMIASRNKFGLFLKRRCRKAAMYSSIWHLANAAEME